MSIDDKVEKYIKIRKAKYIFFNEDLHHLGNAGAVRIALHRLVKSKVIHRLARGIYAKPGYSKFLEKQTLPSIEDVAKAIAKRDKARVVPTGSYALHALGLSTQIPLNIVYLTDGSPRKIKVGNGTITFKKTSPRILALKGPISSLVVQALKEIGEGKVRDSELLQIRKLLKKEDDKTLQHDIKLAPVWISEIMKDQICV